MATLMGTHASLEPLQPEHASELLMANDPDIWRYMPNAPIQDETDMARWIEWRLAMHKSPDLVLLIRDARGVAAGSTSLFDVRPEHNKAEIGWTWIGKRWHGSLVNKQCKRLLLAHAFETMGLHRIQMKCDARNRRSFHAMAALGAVHEGTLRKHDVLWDGFVRDVELFSITDEEWPVLRTVLDARLTAAHA